MRNDIKEINRFLRDISTSELTFTEKGKIVRGVDFDKSLVERNLYEMDSYTYRLSSRERQIYIIIYAVKGEYKISPDTA